MILSSDHNTETPLPAVGKGLLIRIFSGFLILLLWILNSEGTTDSGDGVMHYLFARFAPSSPILYLDHWAKPVFTILASPFAQFGLQGVCIYNLCCSFAAGFFIMMALRSMGIIIAEIALWATVTSPQLFMANFSGLTEPTFAMIIAAGMYLTSIKKFTPAAAIWSFLPLARTEGFFLLPIFGLLFLTKKNIKATLTLGLGTGLFSLAGGLAKGDFLWLIAQNPYKGEAMYGHGAWNHFLNKSEYIWGVPGTIFLTAGLLLPVFFRKKMRPVPHIPLWFTHSLVIVFFVLHSLLWWKGMFGSLGLIRVMAAMAPLFSLTMVLPLQLLSPFIRHQITNILLLIGMIALLAFTPLKQYDPPIKPDGNLILMKDCAEWLEEKYDGDLPRLSYSYPLFSWVLDVDHFNIMEHLDISGLDKIRPATTLKKGELVIWDSFFGPGTYRKYEQFSEDSLFREIKRFNLPDSSGLSIVIFERQ